MRWSTTAPNQSVQDRFAFTSLFLDRPIITVIWHDVLIVPRRPLFSDRARTVRGLRGQGSEVVLKRYGERVMVERSC